MNMTMSRTFSIALVTLMTFAGAASAANVACPAAGSIKESGKSDDGKNYSATAGGMTWKGEVSDYDVPVDVKTLAFVSSTIANNKHLVTCDYHGSGQSALRLSTATTTDYQPADKASWTGSDPQVCENKDVARCESKAP